MCPSLGRWYETGRLDRPHRQRPLIHVRHLPTFVALSDVTCFCKVHDSDLHDCRLGSGLRHVWSVAAARRDGCVLGGAVCERVFDEYAASPYSSHIWTRVDVVVPLQLQTSGVPAWFSTCYRSSPVRFRLSFYSRSY